MNGIIVETENGLIEGETSATGARVFYGVPFAAPPTGERRWKAPQPAENWSGIRKPMKNPPIAVFDAAPVTMVGKQTFWPSSEDCLYMNIYIPPENMKPENGKFPVLVWLHGGCGSICLASDNCEEIAARGLIVVKPARRQGVFAVFAHPEVLADPDNLGSAGHFDLLDGIAALQWVQRNIERFGGDPGNVTLGGRSWGSGRLGMLHASPLAKGLFHKIFSQNGYWFRGTTREEYMPISKALDFGERWMSRFGKVEGTSPAHNLSELKAKSTAEILAVSIGGNGISGGIPTDPGDDTCMPGTYSYSIEIGMDTVLPDRVANIFIDGKQNDVPMMAGWCLEDSTGLQGVTDLASYKKSLADTFGLNAADVFDLYPAFDDQMAIRRNAEIGTDMNVTVRNLSYARLQTMKGKSPVYLWRFDRGNEPGHGAKHGWDTPYWFGNLRAALPGNQYLYNSAADYSLSDKMMDCLVAWCTFGKPETEKLSIGKYNSENEAFTALDIDACCSVPFHEGQKWFLEHGKEYRQRF